MDIELIDRAWRVLPKEFKEEVKKEYLDHHESGDMKFSYRYSDVLTDGYSDALTDFFGEHNLTSVAEEEEMLTVPRKKVQRAYNTSREIVKAENPGSLMYSMHTQIMCVLENIFGSKCLPDAHEDNFTSIEPKPAEQSMTDSETEHTKDEFATRMQGKFTEQDFTEAKQRTESCMASIPQFELSKQIEAQINKAMESIKAESRKQFGDFGAANADIAIPVYRQMMRLGALLVLSAGDLESEQTDSDRGDYISMTKPTDPNK